MSSTDEVDERATAGLHEMVPFTAELGIELIRNDRDEVRGRVAWTAARCTVGGALNGGVIMAVADNTGGLCAFHNLPAGAGGTSTIESKTNFLRAVRGGHVTAISRPLHTGRRVVVVETELRDDDGRLVAKVTQTQAVL